MAEAGRRLAEVLRTLASEVRPGIPTKVLDERARELIRASGAKPAFLGYRPGGARVTFPAALCVSLNDTVVHGLPSERIIQSGDLVKLDIGLIYEDFYADTAITVPVGQVTKEAAKLVEVTREALARGISAVKPGQTLGDIGWAIENYVENHGFSIADSLSGHGIGRELHEEPYVFNTGVPGRGLKLEPGMVLALEPMVNAGKSAVKCIKDDSYVTVDGSLSAHFEHTVVVTDKGYTILTL